MNESNSSYEYGTEYPDPELGVRGSQSWPPAAHMNPPSFSDSCILGGLDDITQQAEYQYLGPLFDDAMNKMHLDDQLLHKRSSDVDMGSEDQQCSMKMKSEKQTVSRRKAPNLVDKDSYTIFCGVYSPEIATPVRDSRNIDSPYHCPRCDKRLRTRMSVKDHFPSCITKHGNPDALKWNDHASLRPIRPGGPRDHARQKKFYDDLKAYSGVTIPSKLASGQVMTKFVSPTQRGNMHCAVCGGGPFSLTGHVKSHFITCVKRYGNPTGANWFDGLDTKSIEKLRG